MEYGLLTPFSLSNAIIIGWCVRAIFRQMRRLDFYTIFYLFSLFFFGVAPLVQWSCGLTLAPLYDEELSAQDFTRINVIVLALFAAFELLYRRFSQFESSDAYEASDLSMRRFPIWVLVVAVPAYMFLWYQEFNPINLLLRGGGGERENEAKMAVLVCGFFCRYVPLSAAFIYWLYGRHRKTVGILLWIVAVAFCLPTGMARLQIVPVYLPAVMVCVPFVRERKYLIVLGLVFGLLIVFPFLHLFREVDINADDFQLFDFSFFNSLHFDSFASFAYIVKQDFVTNGQQLLGATLFWVPRSIWPNKPIESGRMIAETFDLGIPNDFTNIAVNYFAEGYLNFGYWGVALWLVAVAYICARADCLFWVSAENFKRPACLYYFSGIGMLFFLLRGDMMAGVSFSLGLMASHKVMEIVMLRKDGPNK